MSKKNGAGKFILGAGLGAGLALLFAPKKGSELRDDLKLKLDDLVNKAKDIDVEEVSSEFSKKVEIDIQKDITKELFKLEIKNLRCTLYFESAVPQLLE